MTHTIRAAEARVAKFSLAATVLLGSLLAVHAVAHGAEDEPPVEHRLGQHPAVLVKNLPQTVDTNRLILMHPAQLLMKPK